MAILRVISRRLVLQHEASFVNTAAFPSSSYFFRHRSAPDDPSPWIRRGSSGGSLLRPLRGEVTGACDHRNGTSGGLQGGPSDRSPPLSAARATATLCRRRRCRETMWRTRRRQTREIP